MTTATATKYIEQPKNQQLIRLLHVPRTIKQIARHMRVKPDSARASVVRLKTIGRINVARVKPDGKLTRYHLPAGMPRPSQRNS